MARKPAKKPRKAIRPGLQAPRSTKGPLRPFTVKCNSITDSRGIRCMRGENAHLTEKLAGFFAELGKIKVEIRYADYPDEKVGDTAGEDTEEAVDAPVLDPAGSEPGGGTGEEAAPEPAGANPRRSRRKRDDNKDA